jgi:L,D-peptidoglycan transpeptidase YkuD (ErfK/YbiS/YcfS/YnhG family)
MTFATVRRLVALPVAVLLASTLTPISSAGASIIRLGGVRVALQPGTTQVITVNRTRSWRARVVLWERSASGWRAVARARNGRIGYGGLVAGSRRKQGSGATPLGTYRLLSSFGTHSRLSTWDLGYRRIKQGDYWVQDNASAYYNRYRNKAQGGFRWWLTSGMNTSEKLSDFRTQYEYSINTSFNYTQVRRRGAGIFLHVNGRGATAGCASAPRWFIQAAMARLDPRRVPLIAIGR